MLITFQPYADSEYDLVYICNYDEPIPSPPVPMTLKSTHTNDLEVHPYQFIFAIMMNQSHPHLYQWPWSPPIPMTLKSTHTNDLEVHQYQCHWGQGHKTFNFTLDFVLDFCHTCF